MGGKKFQETLFDGSLYTDEAAYECPINMPLINRAQLTLYCLWRMDGKCKA